jgi:hypothetical protein
MVSKVSHLHVGGMIAPQQPSPVKNVLVIMVSVAAIALIGRSTMVKPPEYKLAACCHDV